jgi:hypothetical protein
MAAPHSIPARPQPAVPLLRAPAPALLTTRALLNGVLASVVTVAAVSAWILIELDGWSYYTTPITVRGYHPAHALLRPSGAAGLTFGLTGAALMLAPFLYMLIKRHPRLRAGASLKSWLEFHIFCGIVGPALVTFHTSFKFNGLVSVAYWSMVLVALSGFVGRFLYVRIPRTIRGVEITERELAARIADLGDELLEPMPDVSEERAALERERRQLARRLAHLHRTKQMFDLWHVFHLPLVYVMFAIVSLHVALVLYLGYGPSLWRGRE